MLPHAHLAIGYLAVSGYVRTVERRTPSRRDVGIVLVGSQAPNLLDKPLAILGGPFAGGRSVGHSLVFLLLLLLALTVAARQSGIERSTTLAFAVPTILHPLGDAALFLLHRTVIGDLVEVSFLLWPFTIPAAALVERLGVAARLGD